MIFLMIGAFGLVMFSAVMSFVSIPLTAMGIDLAGPILTWVTYAFAFCMVFWPLQPVALCLAGYIPFKILMVAARAILGARVPDAS